ncbi:class I adenylate-forming enzyme family protein [Thalassospira lucentensis]|uniref:class I adenylate-forming enzyme family protein n=1 Tax=Thalassospira lucentensis TaxID=168935 RepID=UPI00142D526C|nr:class I adenylate-forming enzyme family protein [Thalassospira lucentensis]NIZ00152.1 acyl--CoA ligase [Thalassospira lucentensis]
MIINLPERTRISLITEDKSLSSQELSKEALNIATQLQRFGIGKGDLVVIIASYQPSFFSTLFGAWRAGACVACVNSSITLSEINNICNFVKAKAIVGAGNLAFEEAPAAPYIDTTQESESSHPFTEVVEHGLDDDALMLFTSGTTGTPKGVTHSFRSLFARIAINREEIGDEVLRNTLSPLPTHFGHGLIGNCLTAIFAGAHLRIVPGVSVEIASNFGKLLDEHEISFMSSVPAMWRIITRLSSGPEKQYLRRVHVGSAPLSSDLWGDIAKWCSLDSIWNVYGITEACNWIGGRTYIRGVAEDGLIGKAWGGSYAVKLDDGSIQNHGKGELLVQTPTLMRGYFDRPETTAEALQSGWFHTGDIAVIDEMGNAKLIGRQKNEINRAGLKIHPEDIDILLEKHKDIKEACAFPVSDPLAGQIVGVAIVPEDSSNFDLATVKTHCRENLIPEKNPDRWFVVDGIPKTDRGKINRENVANFCLNE